MPHSAEKFLMSFREQRQSLPEPQETRYGAMRVILTGSTGNMGAYILDALLRRREVEKIYCLNRSSDAAQRQKNNHECRGLPSEFSLEKVEFIQCTLSEPQLGLETATHRHLAREVTHILHNAWPVDFNRHFSSFEPQIEGVRQLANFAALCARDPTLFFVSSVSVAARWGTLAGATAKVPEAVLEDWRTAKMGYGQSKLVSERLLASASESSGISTVICRVGQVAGPVHHGTRGAWSKQEWFPSLLASSKHLGKIPADLGPMDTVDWVPVDSLADIIVELLPRVVVAPAQNRKSGGPTRKARVFHLANPARTHWATLLPAVKRRLEAGGERSLESIGFQEWVDELEASASASRSDADLAMNPAAKLLTFFDDLRDKSVRFPRAKSVELDLTETEKHSQTLASLSRVTAEWMDLWMNQWNF